MSAATPSLILQQALSSLAAGQLAQAERLLQPLLRDSAAPAAAWAAWGQLCAQRRQWAAAAQAYERALQADSSLWRVWFALGEVLEALGRPREALPCFAQAGDRQPGWAPARYRTALLLRELGQQAPALTVAAEAVRLAPRDPNALQLLAMLQEESGQWPAALGTLDTALALAPERAALHHNRAVVLHRLGRHAQALDAHQQAHRLGLDVAEAHYNLGNTWQALGRPDEALAAYRRALALQPLHALTLLDLAKLRWALGHADFTAELEAAERAAPHSDVPPGLLGQLLLRAERADAAVAAYRRAAALAPGCAAYADGLGQALSLAGQHGLACAAHRKAVALAPDDAVVHSHAARSFFIAGEVAQGLALAERAVALAPHDQQALALLGTGWRLSADPRAERLHDLDRCVAVLELAPPPGWHDIERFNAALAEELTRLHTDAQAPIDQSLRQGTQTRGNLFDLELPLVQALRRQLADAITAWLATRPLEPGHPFLGRVPSRPSAWHFTDSWSSRLRRAGFHTNHIHGHGWLSSCYYVATPPSALREGSRDGWIKFGEPDLPEPLRSQLPPWRMEAPRPGRLVLFPSYLWHGTTPFQDDAYRLTVAFDVVPD